MGLYKLLVKPALFRQDPERVHDAFTFCGWLLGSNPFTRAVTALAFRYRSPKLEQTVAGIWFANPIGLAAGFDKDCRLMRIMPAVGFGFEEVGSVTAEPYGGNPKPRLVRLPADESIIVYYGLKNKGAQALRSRFLRKDGVRKRYAIPIGVSIAKTNKDYPSEQAKLDDWLAGITAVKDWGDYLTINLSCPNTYDSNNYCNPHLLQQLLDRIAKERISFSRPVFFKLTADLSLQQADRIITLTRNLPWVTGFILTNLVKDRAALSLKSPKELYEGKKGGISGRPVQPKALALVRYFRERAGTRFVLIGCGGIFTAEDAYAFIRAGASLVQLITGIIYNGPRTIGRINKGLVRLLAQDGFANIADAIGADVPPPQAVQKPTPKHKKANKKA